MSLFILGKFINLMKRELSNSKQNQSHFPWVINEIKYLNSRKLKKLRKSLEMAKEIALRENKTIPIRNWFMVELGLSTGLRVEEMINLKTTDIYLSKEQSFLIVRHGKGNKSRIVYFSKTFGQTYQFFLNWKGKTLSQSEYLFATKNRKQLTKRALQKSFKRLIKNAGLDSHYSIHCLRHTYGSFLYKSSNHNLRLVQEQLGHSSISTTQIYTSVMDDEIKKAIEKLYRA